MKNEYAYLKIGKMDFRTTDVESIGEEVMLDAKPWNIVSLHETGQSVMSVPEWLNRHNQGLPVEFKRVVCQSDNCIKITIELHRNKYDCICNINISKLDIAKEKINISMSLDKAFSLLHFNDRMLNQYAIQQYKLLTKTYIAPLAGGIE